MSKELAERTGARPPSAPHVFQIPAEVSIDDGMSEQDAVEIALWNNPRFQSDLTRLGVAQADLTAASALPNPIADVIFPGGPKAIEATISAPIDLFTRWSRIKASREDVRAAAATAVAAGLTLARDVRVAHADFLLAHTRATLLSQASNLNAEILLIGNAQYEVGRLNGIVYTQIISDASIARVSAIGAENDLTAAGARLSALLGQDPSTEKLVLTESSPAAKALPPVDTLIATALENRPEVMAAEAAVKSAGAKASVEDWKLLNFVAKVKIEQTAGEPTLAGPGGQITLPFDLNQAGRSRAEKDAEKAAHDYISVTQSVRREVVEAYAGYAKSADTARIYQDQILPSLRRQTDLVRANARVGRTSYFEQLVAESRYIQGAIGALDAVTTLRRANAQLAYSLGREFTGALTP